MAARARLLSRFPAAALPTSASAAVAASLTRSVLGRAYTSKPSNRDIEVGLCAAPTCRKATASAMQLNNVDVSLMKAWQVVKSPVSNGQWPLAH